MVAIKPTTVKRGDTHAVNWSVNVDLTNCTVRILARQKGQTTYITLDAEVVQEGNPGIIQHVLTGILPTGTYQIEAEFTNLDGIIFTIPSQGYNVLIVYEDID